MMLRVVCAGERFVTTERSGVRAGVTVEVQPFPLDRLLAALGRVVRTVVGALRRRGRV